MIGWVEGRDARLLREKNFKEYGDNYMQLMHKYWKHKDILAREGEKSFLIENQKVDVWNAQN